MTESKRNNQLLEKPIFSTTINRNGMEIEISARKSDSKIPIIYDVRPQSTTDFTRGYDQILANLKLPKESKVLFASGKENSRDVALKSRSWLIDLYFRNITDVFPIYDSSTKYVRKLEQRINESKYRDEPKGEEVKLMVCFGGQTAQDVVKLVAYRKDIPYVGVFGVISSDGYASDRAVIKKRNKYPISQKATAPKFLFVDTETALGYDTEMDKGYPKFLSSGIGDIVFAKTWTYYDFEQHMHNTAENREALKLVKEPTFELISFIRERKKDDFDGLRDLEGIERLGNFGVENAAEAMRIAKSSKPCSQSDHHWWRIIDRKTNGKILHGISTAQNALSLRAIHEELEGPLPDKYSFDELREVAEQVGIPTQPYKIRISNNLYVHSLMKAAEINESESNYIKDLKKERHLRKDILIDILTKKKILT